MGLITKIVLKTFRKGLSKRIFLKPQVTVHVCWGEKLRICDTWLHLHDALAQLNVIVCMHIFLIYNPNPYYACSDYCSVYLSVCVWNIVYCYLVVWPTCLSICTCASTIIFGRLLWCEKDKQRGNEISLQIIIYIQEVAFLLDENAAPLTFKWCLIKIKLMKKQLHFFISYIRKPHEILFLITVFTLCLLQLDICLINNGSI